MKDSCRSCPVLHTSFFAALHGPRRDAAPCLFTLCRCRKRHLLYQEGNPASRVYILKSGVVKAYRTDLSGRTQIIDLVAPGSVFGLEGLSGGHYLLTAEVAADGEVCHVETSRFRGLLADSTALAQEVIRMLSGSIALYHQRILGLGTRCAQARLAALILGLLASSPAESAWRGVELPVSRQELASLVGVRPETLSRILADLSRGRVVSVEGRRVLILDPARLRALTS